MRSRSSPAGRGALLIAIISPALLGSQFRCVAVSGPTVAAARIEHIEPLTPRVGDIVRATGTGDGTPPLEFAWDFGDGTLAPGVQAAHAYIAPGSYRITFTVRDVNGNAARDSAQIDVSPRLPSPIHLMSGAVAGQPVLFAAFPLEPAFPLEEDTSALSFAWSFSDGQSATGLRAIASFPRAGMYLASVTVTNGLGAIAVAQTAFHVADPAH
jgi:PKD domain